MRTLKAISISPSESPSLLIAVDAEEEFDWSTFSKYADNVTNIRHQVRAHRIFERYGAVPTYLIDFPVASKEAGYKPLQELYQQQLCGIEAQLHPWVNPPFQETVTLGNSFPGNLPMHLEREKLRRLTEEIENRFCHRPTVYRAGRHGFGPNTAFILSDLGYGIDMSVLPRTDLRSKGGPDFSKYGPEPFWIVSDTALLEIPQTVEILGLLDTYGAELSHYANGDLARFLKLPGLLARLRLLDRITLSPEGIRQAEAQRLTRALVARGHRIFVMSYHSSSLCPGHTPYVRTHDDLEKFLAWIEGFLEFFCGEMGGRLTTASEVGDRLAASRPAM